MIKDCQPCSHAIGSSLYIFRIYAFRLQSGYYCHSRSAVVYQTKEGRIKSRPGNVFCHIAGNTAVYFLNTAGISPAGDINIRGESLYIYKDCSDDNHAHKLYLLLRL